MRLRTLHVVTGCMLVAAAVYAVAYGPVGGFLELHVAVRRNKLARYVRSALCKPIALHSPRPALIAAHAVVAGVAAARMTDIVYPGIARSSAGLNYFSFGLFFALAASPCANPALALASVGILSFIYGFKLHMLFL